jgi:hypothetical protein
LFEEECEWALRLEKKSGLSRSFMLAIKSLC